MDGMQNVSFGSLTARNGVKQYTFDFKDLAVEDLDLNQDGILSDEELFTAVKNGEIDIVELSTTDADADMKVTEEQYVLWQQIEEMDKLVEMFKDQAARDLVGASTEDIKKFTDKLTDFAKEFKTNYMLDETNDISKMSQAFNEAMPEKYVEIKKDVMSNTKSAVKSRVIGNVIKLFMQDDGANGGLFAKKINKSSHKLSSNAQRLLTKVLTSEADRFMKSYTGQNLEKDLNSYLTIYLKTSDKEKLAEAIGVWDKDLDEDDNKQDAETVQKYKKKARNLLLSALENNICLKVGDFTVRSESMIVPALAQFKDADSLRWAINKAISELSHKTQIQEIMEFEEEDSEQTTNNVPQVELPEFNEDDDINIFE